MFNNELKHRNKWQKNTFIFSLFSRVKKPVSTSDLIVIPAQYGLANATLIEEVNIVSMRVQKDRSSSEMFCSHGKVVYILPRRTVALVATVTTMMIFLKEQLSLFKMERCKKIKIKIKKGTKVPHNVGKQI